MRLLRPLARLAMITTLLGGSAALIAATSPAASAASKAAAAPAAGPGVSPGWSRRSRSAPSCSLASPLDTSDGQSASVPGG
jgi:uncharacterized membrane protein